MTTDMEQTTGQQLGTWLRGELSKLKTVGRFRERVVTLSGPGWCERDGQRLLNFASNDYLGLCHDARIREAFAAVAEQTAGAGASALVTGRSLWHQRLEATIAEFEGTEAALVFPSGYAANVGTLSAIIRESDVVFCDRLNHASLIDGCRLSGAQFRVYRHDELEKLEERLEKSEAEAAGSVTNGRVGPRNFIVTDGVFSMDGTIAPLGEICEIADRYGAIVIVDEAHGTGVLGETGRGACELLDVEQRVAVRIGTLSKAIGAMGGFVAGSATLIDYLWNSARSQFFSTALPPAVCAAASEAFDVVREEPERREQMWANATLLNELLETPREADGGAETVPIVPVIVGSEANAVAAAKQIEADGFLVACVRPPTVPNNTSRLRISLSSVHTEDDIRALADSVNNAVRLVHGEG